MLASLVSDLTSLASHEKEIMNFVLQLVHSLMKNYATDGNGKDALIDSITQLLQQYKTVAPEAPTTQGTSSGTS